MMRLGQGRVSTVTIERSRGRLEDWDMSAALRLEASQDYPLLNLFWTMMLFFLWTLWIFLLISILIDVFRSSDMGGWAKAGWTIFIIVLPFLGALVYLIVRGSAMAERQGTGRRAADRAQRSYAESAADGSSSVAEEVKKLADLRDRGILTDQEFAAQKAKVLA